MVINNGESGYNFSSIKEYDTVIHQRKGEHANAAAENTDRYTPSSDKELKIISLPTKIYVDSVIKGALKNIELGNNVEENKQIIRLFSNIIEENPAETLMRAYY